MLVDVVANMTTEAHPPCTGASRRASTSRERRTLANVPVCGLSRRTGMSPNDRDNRRLKAVRLIDGLCETERRMEINQQGPTSKEEYEMAMCAAKFAMTNEELDKAIDTAARHSGTSYGHESCGRLMLDHMKKLLDLQLRRAAIVKLGAGDTAHNVK
jgi:hypothetical protein